MGNNFDMSRPVFVGALVPTEAAGTSTATGGYAGSLDCLGAHVNKVLVRHEIRIRELVESGCNCSLAGTTVTKCSCGEV